MNRTSIRYLWIIALALAGCGTEPREAGPIRSEDRLDMGATTTDAADGAAADATDRRDVDPRPTPGGDAGAEEMGGGGGADLEQLPTGITCGYDDLEPFSGSCDPVRVEGCTDPETCLPAVAIVGPDSVLSASCTESDVHVLGEGDDCDGTTERCGPGLMCITFYGVCRRLCYPDTALGCTESQFCRRPSASWEGIGFCDDTCNL